MSAPVTKILYGPPGTGKTYLAAREAVRIIDGVVNEGSVKERYLELVGQGQIFWVTFHPSYSYEDFVEGFRPVIDEQGRLTYRVVDGAFKLACAATRAYRLKVGDRIGFGNRYEVTQIDGSGAVLQSIPNRKDAVVPRLIHRVDFWTIEHLRRSGVGPDEISIPGKDYKRKIDLTRRTGLPTTWADNAGSYAAVYQAIESQGTQARPVALVIDEINRADLSRVFGELMTLLERDKRLGAPEERTVMLPYSRSPFGVPAELSVIGTMNTADRSLAVVDVALRRRFDFEEVLPSPEICPLSYGGVAVRALLTSMNHRIEALRSRDQRIGHSELLASTLTVVRVTQGWADDEEGQLRTLAFIVRERILPLLLEYFNEDWRQAEVVLGARKLLEPVSFEDVAELAGDELDIDVSERAGLRIPDWWNPLRPSWDAARTRTALIGVAPPDVAPSPAAAAAPAPVAAAAPLGARPPAGSPAQSS